VNITKVTINKLNNDYKIQNNINKNTLAILDLVINHDIIITGIKLMNGKKGKYLVFPEYNETRYIAFPIKEKTRLQILDSVLEEYNKSGD